MRNTRPDRVGRATVTLTRIGYVFSNKSESLLLVCAEAYVYIVHRERQLLQSLNCAGWGCYVYVEGRRRLRSDRLGEVGWLLPETLG